MMQAAVCVLLELQKLVGCEIEKEEVKQLILNSGGSSCKAVLSSKLTAAHRHANSDRST